MTKEITNSEDVIDSRDIIERISELEEYDELTVEGVIRELMAKPFGLFLRDTADIEELAVHEAMHDSFCLGIAAASRHAAGAAVYSRKSFLHRLHSGINFHGELFGRVS